MTKNFTAAQMKEILEIHETTIIKCFTAQIDRLEGKINSLESENKHLKDEVAELRKSVEFQNAVFDDHKKAEKERNDNERREKESNADKLAMLEDRSRRDNLRFCGLDEVEGETWSQSEERVKRYISNELGIEKNIEMHRAHRTGRKPETGPRPIVAKFKDFHDRELILRKYVELRLWENQTYVNEDFSVRTVAKRKQLFKEVKELRADGKFFKVVYNRLVEKTNTEESRRLEAEIISALDGSTQ